MIDVPKTELGSFLAVLPATTLERRTVPTVSTPEGITFGGLALLQATLALISAGNGGLKAAALNRPTFVLLGITAVVLAIIVTGVGLLLLEQKSRARKLLTGIGIVLVGLGIVGAAAATIFVPSSKPSIDVTLKPAQPLTYQANVAASGLSGGHVVHIAVDGLREREVRGKVVYRVSRPPLYFAQLGPDEDGEVKTSLTIPVPAHRYQDIGIQAWTGDNQGPCNTVYKSMKPLESNRGCVVMRVTGL